MQFISKAFKDLRIEELYEIMRLRQEVFIVEQDCPYLDADGVDYHSYQVMGLDEKGKILAHTRLVPKGIAYPEYASIGRVVLSKLARGKGLGKSLMEYSIDQCKTFFPNNGIKISAQNYLLEFYEDLNFKPVGESYLEDGIPHTAMILSV